MKNTLANMKPLLGELKNRCLQNKGHRHIVTRREATDSKQQMFQKGQSERRRDNVVI